MTPRLTTLVVSAAAGATLAAYVFWRYGKQRLHRHLAVMVAGSAAFSLFQVGLAAASNEAAAGDWIRYAAVLPYFTVISAYRFSMVFSQADRRRGPRLLLWLALAAGAADVSARLAGIWPSRGLVLVPGQGWFPVDDPLYRWAYVPVMICMLGGGLLLMSQRLLATRSGFERRQFGYVGLAIASAMVLSAFNLVPQLAVLAALNVIVSSLVLVYGMTRHQLLGLQLLVRTGATAALASLLLATVTAGLILVDVQVWGGQGWFALFSGALAFSLCYPLFQTYLKRFLGGWIGHGPLDLGAELLEYSLLNVQHPRLESQLLATLQRLVERHGLSQASILLPDKQGRLAVFHRWPAGDAASAGPPLDMRDAVAERLAGGPSGLELDSLGWVRIYEERGGEAEPLLDQRCREFLLGHQAQAAFSLKGRQRPVGVLLVGPPVSGRALEADELKFFAALASQLSALVENAALRGRVEHADRLSTLGTLGAGLAHELRNPLASISVFVQMLPERHQEVEFVNKFNHVVLAELDKLTNLTTQLLNLARPATRAPRVVDLGALCQRLHQLVSFQYRTKEVRLAMSTPEGTLVHGVEEELSQVILNLLLNALDACRSGGNVQVRLAHPTGWADLRVIDDGAGLSPDQLSRIFEPFFTTKEHGHGLGLATSLSIVHSLGGTLSAENNPDQGAQFILRLPQVNPADAT